MTLINSYDAKSPECAMRGIMKGGWDAEKNPPTGPLKALFTL